MQLQQHDRIAWSWKGHFVQTALTWSGTGPTVLMLPALSSISTRGEMRPLQDRLSRDYATVAVDWPGFGDMPRPAVAWGPQTYRDYLDDLLADTNVRPYATIAAGHAAGYLLAAARARPGCAGRLCLIAPTWRGPLPTVTNKPRGTFAAIATAGDLPYIGAALYGLNVNPFMVRKMVLGHVLVDPAAFPEALIAEKMAVTRAPGARHAGIRFVCGELDPMASREEWLNTARKVSDPVLVIYGADTPLKSKAEMEALAALPNVQSALLPEGKLGIHEEFADRVAVEVRALLHGSPSASAA
jgi:pimeloyl-ACP methyl ester carboxylesterase